MQCKRCKKHFDYEEHYGICPNCGFFNRPDGRDAMDLLDPEERERFNWTEKYEEPAMNPEHQKLHREYDTNRQTHKKTSSSQTNCKSVERRNGEGEKKKGGNRILIFLFIVLFIVLAAGVLFAKFGYRNFLELKTSTIYTQKETEMFPEDAAESGQEAAIVAPTQEVQTGEVMELGEGLTLTFGEAKEVNTKAVEELIPEGQKLIAVQYSWSKTDDESSYTGYLSRAYLKCDRLYREPLYFTDEDESAHYEELLGIHVGDLSEVLWKDSGEGTLCYLAEESAADIELALPVWEDNEQIETPTMVYLVHLTLQ